MQKKLKKAFTIVELAIVIAVIAILAAVLIPTFSNVMKGAQESADTQLVANLNKILSADELLNGKPATMGEALATVSEAGYSVEKLSPRTKGEDIVWDSQSNRFALVDGTEKVYADSATVNVTGVTVWKITDDLSEVQKADAPYSYYVTADANTAVLTNNTLVIATGADISSVDGAIDVQYINSAAAKGQEVVLCTNGGEVAVNAPLDTVNHYGAASSVDIIAVYSESYHEYGSVSSFIQLKSGRLVIENGAAVSGISLTADSASAISVENKSSGKITVSATDTEVAKNIGTVVKSGNTTNIETATNTIGATYFAGGDGSAESPYLISTAEQFYNIYLSKEYNGKNFKLTDDITVSKRYTYSNYWGIAGVYLYNSVFDGGNHTITVGSEGTNLFAATKNITLKDLNVVLTDSMIVDMYADSENGTLFENVNVSGAFEVGNNTGAYAIYAEPLTANADGTYAGKFTFSNCTANVTMTGAGGTNNYNAVFVGYSIGYSSNNIDVYNAYYFENCVNEGSLICGRASMFIGNLPNAYAHATINVDNCSNNGLIQSTYVDANYSHFVSIGVARAAVVMDGATYTGEETLAASLSLPCGESGAFVQGPSDTSLTLRKNSDGTFTVTQSQFEGASYYVVSVSLYATLNIGGTNVFSVSEKITANQFADGTASTSQLKYLSFVDDAWVQANAENVTKTEIVYADGTGYTVYTTSEGVSYYYMSDDACNLGGAAKSPYIISVSAYDENGVLLSSASLSK